MDKDDEIRDNSEDNIELVRLRREVQRLKTENSRLTTILMQNNQEEKENEKEIVEPEVSENVTEVSGPSVGLDGTDIQVELFGLEEGLFAPIMKVIKSNDSWSENEPVKLARDISVLADYIINCYHVNHARGYWSTSPEVFRKTENNYNTKLYIVNEELHHLLKQRDNATFWRHRGLWKNTPDLLLKDKA
ncbi:unnamed protein product [Mytilus coruscus]|uniref:Uncharacterized protein n=1 Tax=Mytilus coruscus TaxID=42192 RepID=A0A6J8CKC5_MYTCO|nr:unnamed protein product [Mytilus coruscus]